MAVELRYVLNRFVPLERAIGSLRGQLNSAVGSGVIQSIDSLVLNGSNVLELSFTTNSGPGTVNADLSGLAVDINVQNFTYNPTTKIITITETDGTIHDVNLSDLVDVPPVDSVNGKTGVVVIDKSDVGLGNVDNTSDADKPISTAQQTALDGKADTSHTHTASQITDFDTEVSNNSSVAANTAKVSFPEAPADGKQYARKDNGWEEVTGGATGTIHSSTQWSTTLAPSPIADGFFANLFSVLTDLEKVASGTTSYDEYTITAGNLIVPYVGEPYENQRIHHLIRLNFNIQTGSRQNARVELRRTVDDTVIGSAIVADRNPDETGIQINFVTYTNSSTDPFVTGGFYIAFVNDSGATLTLDGDLGVLIQNTFQEPLTF